MNNGSPAKYPGSCAMCFGYIRRGESIMWSVMQRVIYHIRCYNKFHNLANR